VPDKDRNETMEGLQAIRATAARILVIYLWGHVPLVALVGWSVGTSITAPTALAALLSAGATLVWWLQRDSAATRYTIAVALALMPAVLVYQLSGHPWQIDLHMYFFAAIAMTTVFCDWRAVLAAAAAVAVHHLLLNFALPAAVFPGGASLARVVLHAVVVVIEAGVLIWLAARLVMLFTTSEAAVAEAQRASQEVEQAARRQHEAEEQAQQEKAEMLARLADEFDRTIGQVIATMTEQSRGLEEVAASMLQLASETSSGAAQLTGSTEAATGDVQAVASAADELRASIHEISGRSSQSGATTSEALGNARTASEKIEELAATLADIGSVVTLIQDIAEQTNLLALNATIEAARAGDAGKGFAVVAQEVKQLSGQTAKATDDITSRIRSIQQQSDLAVAAISAVGQSMDGLSEAVASISGAIEEQNAATGEIARSAEQASTNVRSATQNAALVSDATDRTRTTAESVARAAQDLSLQGNDLRRKMEEFLTRIRAA